MFCTVKKAQCMGEFFFQSLHALELPCVHGFTLHFIFSCIIHKCPSLDQRHLEHCHWLGGSPTHTFTKLLHADPHYHHMASTYSMALLIVTAFIILKAYYPSQRTVLGFGILTVTVHNWHSKSGLFVRTDLWIMVLANISMGIAFKIPIDI